MNDGPDGIGFLTGDQTQRSSSPVPDHGGLEVGPLPMPETGGRLLPFPGEAPAPVIGFGTGGGALGLGLPFPLLAAAAGAAGAYWLGPWTGAARGRAAMLAALLGLLAAPMIQPALGLGKSPHDLSKGQQKKTGGAGGA